MFKTVCTDLILSTDMARHTEVMAEVSTIGPNYDLITT